MSHENIITHMTIILTKLNDTCKKSLDSASALCRQKTNYNVELSHFLIHLFNYPSSDIYTMLRAYEIDIQLIISQLSAAIERLPKDNHGPCPYSKHIFMLLEKAWLISSLEFDEPYIRSGSILWALIDDDMLRGLALENCPLLLRISRHVLRQDMKNFLHQSIEEVQKHEGVTDMQNVLQSRGDSIELKRGNHSLEKHN